MRKDKFKIQIGDTVYMPSKSYNRVFTIKIIEIWIEHYFSEDKTIVLGEYEFGKKEFFLSDISCCYDTREEAEKALKGGAK